MFEVLAFVYDNYSAEVACPEAAQLQRKLHAVGFEPQDIAQALDWLAGLSSAACLARPQAPDQPTLAHPTWLRQPGAQSTRVFSVPEHKQLGRVCMGYLCFLDATGLLPVHVREVVMDRVMAVSDTPLTLSALKTMVLMVFWTFGQEPDVLLLDELCDDPGTRTVH